MVVVSLTDKRVAAVTPPKTGRSALWDKLVPGLALRVTERDARTWSVIVWVGPADARTQRRVKLGHPRRVDGEPVLTLAQARDAAREIKRLAAEGKPLTPSDPGHDRAEADTFGTLVAAYLKQLAANARASTVKEAQRVLTHKDLADWRDRRVASITPEDVRKLRDRIADRGAEIQSNGRWLVSRRCSIGRSARTGGSPARRPPGSRSGPRRRSAIAFCPTRSCSGSGPGAKHLVGRSVTCSGCSS